MNIYIVNMIEMIMMMMEKIIFIVVVVNSCSSGAIFSPGMFCFLSINIYINFFVSITSI